MRGVQPGLMGAPGQRASMFKVQGAVGGTSSPVVSFSGMAAGDLCIVVLDNRGSAFPSAPTGWTFIGAPSTDSGSGNNHGVYYKRLDAADMAAGSVTFTGSSSACDLHWLAYSGPYTCAHATSAESAAGASTLALPGYAQPPNGVGTAIYVQEGSSSEGTGFVPNGITGVATRRAAAAAPGSLFPTGLYDVVEPANNTGGAFNFNGFSTSAANWGFTLKLLA